MEVFDDNLRLRFLRQPRTLGTLCIYAPLNKLLQNPNFKPGCMVRIVSYPEIKEDLFVNVIAYDDFSRIETAGKFTVSEEFIKKQGLPPEKIHSVMWKDLAQ